MALQGSLSLNTAQYERALEQARQAMRAWGGDVNAVAAQAQRMMSSLDGTKIVQQANAAAAAIQGIGGVTALTEKEARKYAAAIDEGIAKTKAMGREVPAELSKVARELDGVTGKAQGFGDTARTALGTLAGYLGAQAITAGLQAIKDGFSAVASTAIEVNSKLETSTLQFETLMGSADQAQAHVRGLFDFAARTPFETQPIIEASRQLEVFGGAALNTKDNLRLVGDAAAATGAPINEVARWVSRMYAAMAQGRPLGEAIQNLSQLGVVGPEAAVALQRVAGSAVPVSEKFAVMQENLSRFSGAMEKQAGTWQGVLSTFKESAQLAIAEGLRPLFEAARDALGQINQITQSSAFEGWSVSVSRAIQVVADWVREIPRGLLTVQLGFAAIRMELLEIPRLLADVSLRAARTLGNLARDMALVPGLGGQAMAGLGAFFANRERAAIDDVAAVAAEVRKAKDDFARATVAVAAFESSLKRTGDITLPKPKHDVKEIGNLAEKAAGQIRGMGAALDLLNRPGYFTEFLRTGSLGVDIRRPQIISQDLTNPWGGVGFLAPAGGSSNFSHLTRPGFSWGTFGAQAFNTVAPLVGNLIPRNQGTQIGGMLGGLGATLGVSLGSIGGTLGSVLPGIGTIAGMVVGSLIGKLMGPSRGAILGREADQRMNQTRAGLLDQYGSLDAIRATGPVGSALADAWGSKNVQGEQWFNTLTKAFQEQNQILAEQEAIQAEIKSLEEQRALIAESLIPTWAEVSRIIDKYQIAEGSLGRQINQLGTTDSFKTVINDMDTLFRAGADVGGVLYGMREEISKLVRDSVKFGTEIPANMKPFILELAKSGNLLDENGKSITDIAHLKWGAPVETEAEKARAAMEKIDLAIEKLKTTFDELAAKIQQIMDRLANGLPAAAAAGAAGANQHISTIEPPTPGGDRGEEATGYANGGVVYAARGRWIPRGTDTVPAMLSPGEFVMSAAATRRLGVGTLKALNNGSGVGGVNVTINVAGYLDSQIARAHLASTVASELGRELRQRRRA